jgi:CBS domain containing-hemolysin-like protein
MIMRVLRPNDSSAIQVQVSPGTHNHEAKTQLDGRMKINEFKGRIGVLFKDGKQAATIRNLLLEVLKNLINI